MDETTCSAASKVSEMGANRLLHVQNDNVTMHPNPSDIDEIRQALLAT